MIASDFYLLTNAVEKKIMFLSEIELFWKLVEIYIRVESDAVGKIRAGFSNFIVNYLNL